MKRNLVSYCLHCGCARCARQENCPNEGYACAECTPANPAWNCAGFSAAPKGGRGR